MVGRAIMGTAYAAGAPPLTLPTTSLLAAWDARSGVTEAGTGVSSWVDYHGSFNAVQTTDANRPSLVAAALGGKSVIRFTRANSDLLNITGLSITGGNYTVYAAMSPTPDSFDQYLLDWQTTRFIAASSVAATNRTSIFSNGSFRANADSVTGAQALTWQVNGGASTSEIWRNGVSIGTGTAGNTNSGASGTASMGARFDGSFGHIDADIAALFIYEAAHDSTARAAVWAYITQEWGV